MISIFIINRNRLTSTRKLVDWLLDACDSKITIIDNDSTYPPLLEYYQNLSVGIELFRNDKNGGPYVFWDEKQFHSVKPPYIITDSDLVPADCCPKDLVQHLVWELAQHPTYFKIGCALRIDNLPESPWQAGEIASQSRYWKERLGDCYIANVDTTFAIYRDCFVNSSAPALRTGPPYLMEHTPWYIWPFTEEELYFREHTTGWSGTISAPPYFRWI